MRRTARLLFAIALSSAAASGCGGRTDEGPETESRGDLAEPDAEPTAQPDAGVDATIELPVLFDTPDASPPPLQSVDAGPSECVALGGKCLELIPCDGVYTSYSCGWSAICCMPVADGSPVPMR